MSRNTQNMYKLLSVVPVVINLEMKISLANMGVQSFS